MGSNPTGVRDFFFAFLRRYYLGYLLEHFNLSHLILYVSKIPNAISTNLLVVGSDDSEIDEEEQSEEMSESTVGLRSVTPTTETDDEPWSSNGEGTNFIQKRTSNTARLIDNKRQKLEKTLSANQRDQVLFEMARDELGVKRSMC